MADAPPRRVVELLGAPEPVSFYDALAVVRPLLRVPEVPPEVTLEAILALHDAEHTTDGGREVLADFLARCASRIEAERARGRRPVGPRDQGQTVRLPVGATVELRLPSRRHQGRRWEAPSLPRGLAVELGPPDDGPHAQGWLRGTRPGRYTLRLAETGPGGEEHDSLELRLVITA